MADQKSKKKKGSKGKKRPLHNKINATLSFSPEPRCVFVWSQCTFRDLRVLQQAVKIPPLRRSFPLSYGSRRESVQQSLPSSINRYVDNILCTEREKMCPEIIKRLLTFLSENCEDQTLKVEEELRKQTDLSVSSRFFGHKYVLQ